MGRPFDDFADLADAAARGALAAPQLPADRVRTFDDLRLVFVVELGSWELMLKQLLGQIAEDAGTLGRGLSLLGLPTALIRAWLEGADQGTRASVRWLSQQDPDTTPDIRLRPMRFNRGDRYADLADSARSFRLRGDGELDPAQLRPEYRIERRRSWLRMVGELLGQVVADAGERERAALLLGIKPRRLAMWIRWLVSRGSVEAARASWPVAWVARIDGEHDFDDLAAAVLRGQIDGAEGYEILPVRQLCPRYIVPLASWDEMQGGLLDQIAADAGSIRKAAKVIKLPKSTYSARLRRYRDRRRD